MTPTLLLAIRIGVFLLISYTFYTHARYSKRRGYWIPRNRKDIYVLGGDLVTLLGAAFILFMLHKNFQQPMEKVMSYEKKAFPSFSFQPIGGVPEMSLEDYKGKVVLVNIWATWCGPCRKEMPELDELQKDLKETSLQVVAISDEPISVVQKFLEDKPYSFVSGAFTKSNEVIDGIDTRPTSILIDKNGNVVDIVVGARGYSFFRNWVEKYLK